MTPFKNFLLRKPTRWLEHRTNEKNLATAFFRALVESGRSAYPLNPAASEIEGHAAYASIEDLPVVPEALSIITPPTVTRNIVAAAIAAGVKNIWMQPGAQDEIASQSARAAGINVIDDGSCILVLLAQQK